MSTHRPPLAVHIVFHPESSAAREMARAMHVALNADANVPGLRVPTVFCPEDDSYTPPTLAAQKLDRAERSMVCILADEHMDTDPEWCAFAAALWLHCDTTAHRCVPFQLSEHAWPLDDRLDTVSFVRAHAEPEDTRTAFVIRRMVTELCRLLHGDTHDTESPKVPVKLFISHTKLDLEREPRVVDALHRYLAMDQPIKTWIDSGDVPGGSRFTTEIEGGLEDTSLLCVRTDNYSSREWCRREVMVAKQHQRPMVVVDALHGQEVRTFPYLGNAPEIRWNDNVGSVVDLILKETLRHLVSSRALEQWKAPGDTLFVNPPEHLTTAAYPDGTRVLYPDPPISQEESATLAERGVTVRTPLERLALDRPLRDKQVAISVSECPGIQRHGLDRLHFDDMVQDLVRYLLLKGVRLVYGGHLEIKGFTDTMSNLVAAHNGTSGVDPVERVKNYVGWPVPYSKALESKYKGGAELIRVPRPDGIDESLDPAFVAEPDFFSADVSPLHRYAWSKGMTAMRKQQTAACFARIVIGGKFGPPDNPNRALFAEEKWYAGRIPGTLEELVCSLEANQPVFLLGGFGGVAGEVVDLLEGRAAPALTWAYQRRAPHAETMRDTYYEPDNWQNYDAIRTLILERGIEGLNPGLSADEHRVLFHSTDPTETLELVLHGLNNLSG